MLLRTEQDRKSVKDDGSRCEEDRTLVVTSPHGLTEGYIQQKKTNSEA